MTTTTDCQPCAPVPTLPLAPPPTCPSSAACEEYVLSDCVVSTIDVQCTTVYNSPSGPQFVGLDINLNTTLTDVYSQLTSTACPTNPNTIGAILQIIGDPSHPNYNIELHQLFATIVCNINCSDPCEGIQEVEQITFSSTTDTGFVINWFGIAGYIYSIRINDSNASPLKFYTWTSPVILTTGMTSVNTSLFTSSIGGSIGLPPAVLDSNHSFEVYISAAQDGTGCETGPFTTMTLGSGGCICNNIVTVVPATSDGVLDPLELSVGILVSGDTPIEYNVLVQNTSGTVMVNPPLGVNILYAPDILTNLTYYSSLMPAGGDYTVTVTAICSLVPLCTGGTNQIVVSVPDSLACSAPDITGITINS